MENFKERIAEIKARKERAARMETVRKCAKALYLIAGDVWDVSSYIDALVDGGELTETERVALFDSISAECAPMTGRDRDAIRALF